MKQWLIWSPILFIGMLSLSTELQAIPGLVSPDGESAAIHARVIGREGPVAAGVRVSLAKQAGGYELTLTTDAHGEVHFVDVPPGTHWLTVPGFTTAQRVALESGEKKQIELSATTPSFRDAVTVTATRTLAPVREVGKTLDIVGEDQLESRNEYSLAESLRTVAGLRIQQLGGPGGFVSIKVRGLRNEDTSVLIDGAPLRDVAAPQGDASGFLEALVATDVESLEILRGAGSTVHGSHAGGGTINIITKSGGGSPGATALIEAGGLGLVRARAQSGGGFDSDRLTYTVGATHINVSKGVDGDDPLRNSSVQGRMQFRMTPSSTLSAQLYGASVRLGLNESPESFGSFASSTSAASALGPEALRAFESGAPLSELDTGGANFIPAANDPDSRRESGFISTGLTLATTIAPDLSWSLRYHGLFSNRAFIDGPLGVSAFEPSDVSRSQFDGSIHTAGSSLEWSGPANQRWLFSYEFERELFDSGAFPGAGAVSSTVEVVQRHHSLFVQDEIELGSRLRLQASARAQFFSLDEPTLTPDEGAPFQGARIESPDAALALDLAVAVRLDDDGDTRLNAHVGSGYRAPSLFERFGASFSTFGYSVFGDPRLASERSVTFDLGVSHQSGDGLGVGATYFQTDLRDIIIFDFSGAIDPATDPFGRFGGYLQASGGMSRGVELTVEASLDDKTRLLSTYTLTDADAPSGTNDELSRAYVIPRHAWTLLVDRSLTQNLSLSFDLWSSSDYLAPIFNGATFTSPALVFDGPVKADLAVHYHIPLEWTRLRLFGTVENLFGDDYYENGFRTPSRTARGGISVQF